MPSLFVREKTVVPPPVHPLTPWPEQLKNTLLLALMVVPVIVFLLVGAVVGVVVMGREAGGKLLLRTRQLLGHQPAPVPPEPELPEESFRNAQVRLLLTGEDWENYGPEFSAWYDLWAELEHEYGNLPGFYRLHTEPEIPDLHGQLVSDLCRETPEGLFLQVLELRPGQEPAATSWLVFLEFATLRHQRVAETGDFYLLPHAEATPDRFEGIRADGSRLVLQVQTDI
ncbi:hypothetical protein [Hymenobacter swuensis]|uniref:Uncharacterized protein n=1 Tax=Hymenobacter swuensis DY53 TaxID=1227739 RepID=W8EYB0_9BACT|nr:hypothetical protein [Hymenobacter swuensis]AHJ98089.1 hypothetical protein Hsw_2494 [Hymenobacter swuensis DY53]